MQKLTKPYSLFISLFFLILFSCSNKIERNSYYFIENLEAAKSISCKFIEEEAQSKFFIYPNSIVDVVKFQGRKCLFHESWETNASLINFGMKNEFSLSFEIFISSDLPDHLTIDPIYKTETGIFFHGSMKTQSCLSITLCADNPRKNKEVTKSLKFNVINKRNSNILRKVNIDFPFDKWIKFKIEYKNKYLYITIFKRIYRI